MNSTGTTIIIQINHNESIVRDSVSGSGWREELHQITADAAGAGTIITDMKNVKFAFASLVGAAAGTAPPAVDLESITLNGDTDHYEIPLAGDISGVYHVRLIGKFEGK